MASIRREEAAPLRLDGPADEPVGVRLTKGGNGGQRVENVSHRAKANDEQTQGFRAIRQSLIFSCCHAQKGCSGTRESRLEGEYPGDGGRLIDETHDEFGSVQRSRVLERVALLGREAGKVFFGG
jgi:hypothetical protein